MPKSWLDVSHRKQELDSSCIPACVRMVLAFHGLVLPEVDLRQLLDSRASSGTVLRNLFREASLGFEVDIGPANLSLLRDAINAGQPPIAFVQTDDLDYWQLPCDHAVVVVGMDDSTVWLNDPYFDTAPQQAALTSFLHAWARQSHYAAFIRPKP